MKFVTHVALGPNSLQPIQAPGYFDIYNASRQRSPNATADLPKKKTSKKKSKKLKGGTGLIERKELTLGGRSPSSHSLMELYSKEKKKSTRKKSKR